MRNWLLVSMVVLASVAHADPVASVDARWGAVKVLEAKFTQVQRDYDGSVLNESEGRFVLERPGRFRWDYRLPFEQSIISDGETVWIHDPDLKQVSRRPAAAAMEGTPAAVLASGASLGAAFDVMTLPSEGGAEGWRLTPHAGADSEFSRIDLWMVGAVPQRLVFSDPLGGTTEVVFLAPTLNGRLPRDTFRFSPPREHEVIDLQ